VIGLLVVIGLFVTSGTFMHIAHEHDWEQELPETHDHGGELHVEIVNLCGNDLQCVRERLLATPDWSAHAALRLRVDDDLERAWWVEALAGIDDPAVPVLLLEAANRERDPMIRLEMAAALLHAGERRGARIAVALLADDTPPLIRDDAYSLITEEAGREFGYDSFSSAEENAAALALVEAWAATI
jgi:hypothetical protein